MSSLVARFAGNVYWLGRYLERAESLARLIDTNETYARDESAGSNWERLLRLYAELDGFAELYDDPEDAQSVLNFFMLDKRTPSSIVSMVRAARENARSTRHLISTEMWTHLNVFYERLSQLSQRDLWLSHLSRTCTDIKVGCQTFEGIAEGTFFRGEAWTFYHLGKYLERADQTTRILDMGYDQLAHEDDATMRSVQWGVLLRSVSGYHAFKSHYPAAPKRADVARFLLYDDEFPRAVALCVAQISNRLDGLWARHRLSAHEQVEKARKNLVFRLETGLGKAPTPAGIHKFLDKLQVDIGGVSAAIADTYFTSR